MSVYATIMSATYLIVGVGTLYVGLRARQAKLPMNSWIGLRTPKLMANEDTWVHGHKAAAGYLMFAGASFTIGGILFMIIDESLIAFVSLPVLAILLITMVTGTKKANVAAEQYRESGAFQ